MSTDEVEWQSPTVEILSNYSFVLVVIALVAVDLVPRFFQGDSVSYLMTGSGWIPSDRSWAFGYLSNFFLRHTHCFSTFILFQVAIMTGLIAAARIFFSNSGASKILYGAIAVLMALDPLLEVYTRFFMSDLLSVSCFFGILIALFYMVRDGASPTTIYASAVWFIVATFMAVYLRVAYVVIIELLVVGLAILMCRRLRRRQWIALFLAGLGPFVAVGSLAQVNRVVFGNQFHHEAFVNRLSGIFTASVFAPALQRTDFEKAGIPITAAEFQQLDLQNYAKRSNQVWGNTHADLQQFIKDKLNIKEDYTAAVNTAASGLVQSAFRRDPVGIARVYVVSALDYTKPEEWKYQAFSEMGFARPLPDYFVTFVNSYSVLKIEASTSQIPSRTTKMYSAAARYYPWQLLIGLLSALYLLVVKHGNPSAAVLTAGLLATMAAAPLYSDYVIARYLIGAIIISYLIFGLAIQSAVAGRASRVHASAVAAPSAVERGGG